MKYLTYILPFFFLVSFASAQSIWFPEGQDATLVDTGWGLLVPGIASSTNGCLSIASNGYISTTGLSCGGSSSAANLILTVSGGTTYYQASTTGNAWLFPDGFVSQASSTIGGDVAFGDPTKFFWDNTNSKLGIGTSTPNNTLQVANSSSNADQLMLSNLAATANIKHWNIGVNQNGQLLFSTSSDALVFTSDPVFTLNRDGTVGLGISAPNSQFEISLNNGNLSPFMVSSNDVGSGDVFVILDDGTNWNTGIGTSTPYAKLSVQGIANPQDLTLIDLFTVASSSGGAFFNIGPNGDTAIWSALGASSTLAVDGLSTLTGFISSASSTIGGDVTITGNSTTTGFLEVGGSGTSTFTGGIDIDGEIDVGAVAGTSTFNGGLTILGSLRHLGLVSCDTIDTDVTGQLRCGSDETGGAGSLTWGQTWEINAAGYLAPTTSITTLHPNGFVSQASSTVNGDFLVTGDATTTGLSYLQNGFISSASSTVNSTFNLPTLSDGNLVVYGGTVLSNASTTYSGGVAYAAGNVTNTLTAGDGLTRTVDDILCDTASGLVFGCLASADWTTFNSKQATLSATWPQILTGATLSFGGLSTSSDAVVGNIPYFSGVNTFANVATATVSCTTGAACTSFDKIGTGAISITTTLGTSVDLASEITGILPRINGGTSTSTRPTDGHLLGGDDKGEYGLFALIAGTNVTISTSTLDSSGLGTITINSTGGSANPADLILTPVGGTTYYQASTTGNAWNFPDGFVSTGSSTVNGTLEVGGAFSASSTAVFGSDVTITGLTSALVQAGAGGLLAEYGGSSCGANTFAESISALGVVTCGNIDVSTADITGDLPFANLTQGGAYTILSNNTGATADFAANATSSLFAEPNWQFLTLGGGTYVQPTSTLTLFANNGFIANASSTINGDFFVNSGATTTGLSYLQSGFISSASSTVLGDFTLTGILNIASSSAVTLATMGDIAVSSATTSLRFYDGTAIRSISGIQERSVVYASSTLDFDGEYSTTGTTTYIVAHPYQKTTLMYVFCKVTAGGASSDSAYAEVGSGTSSSTVNCTESGAESLTQITFQGRGKDEIYMAVGLQTNAPSLFTISYALRPED